MIYRLKQLVASALSLCFIITLLVSCGKKAPDITGTWEGKLVLPQASLRIVCHISEKDGKLTATLDSPDQGAKGIAVESVELNNSMVQIKIPALTAMYQGKLMGNDSIVGTFTQGAATLPLDLVRKSEVKMGTTIDVTHDKYTSETVVFNNKQAGINLAGTLTLPKNTAHCPIAVLVTGSGPQNRNEELMGQKPFARIADYLSSNGIAVLRYDDRGVGDSEGDFAKATTADFLSDALAAVAYARQIEGVDTARIGIIGHSEGAAIAMMAAAANRNIAFIVPLASPMMQGKDLLLLQADKISEASGMDAKTVAVNHTLNSAIYAILEKQPNDKQAQLDIIATIEHYAPNDEMKKAGNMEMIAKTVLTPWFRKFITLNPADYLKDIHCPALILFGEKDLQVPAIENIAAMNKVVGGAGKLNFTVKTIVGVNHLFQDAVTGTPNEYSNTANPAMNDQTLQIILDWLNSISQK